VTDYLHDRLVAAVGDHYIIEAELGRGGMGAVYRALDVRLNRYVAIKVLPPDLAFNPSVKSRFLREAQMAARLAHPNIVPIYAVDEREGLVYFVMALIDGDSVGKRLSRQQSIPFSDVRRIAAAVADALDYAHGQGVVHRDIKPDNILLDVGSGRPMVTDFGIARAAAEQSRLTVTGVAVGTPAYMSPEQAMGERDVDGRSDIYSLGIVTYQMIAGETPFQAGNTPSMLMKHVSEPPPPLHTRRADVPPDLAAAVERALAKRPEGRWASAGEFRDALIGAGHRFTEPRAAAPAAAPSRSEYAEPRAPAALPPGDLPQPGPLNLPGLPWMHVPPPGLSRSERRRWFKDQRRYVQNVAQPPYARADSVRHVETEDEKIGRLRRSLASYGGVVLLLFGINAATGGYPWFIFPALGMMVPLVRQLGSLWGDGVPLRRVFFGALHKKGAITAKATLIPEIAPQEILDGPHGRIVQRAAANRQAITDMLGRTSAREREMLPADVEATVTALVERVVAVATTLHRLDEDANGAMIDTLEARVVALRSEPQTSERDRRIALLERQVTTLRDLMERRNALLSQLESASLALENLKLDLVRFRSAGVSSAFEDVTSATREARAVSRDIGHLLDAADDVRKL